MLGIGFGGTIKQVGHVLLAVLPFLTFTSVLFLSTRLPVVVNTLIILLHEASLWVAGQDTALFSTHSSDYGRTVRGQVTKEQQITSEHPQHPYSRLY